ncbi:alpha/beta-hydrolase [Daldinia caldariorum]|uniref:alpha/beta-hydrolase n=1 Tax=Daldinia caldariorum TaxID=326644 RepID=UPI00200763C9|nr:alpha/beta-hydrolase [Daldinia caldariorum]KAI1468710.1 alpha/beta-hydrolase [Daldinia caldariorum]
MSETINLPHKPNAPLSYRLVPGQGPLSTTHLVVYLNGLIGSQSIWNATIEDLQRRWGEEDEDGRSAAAANNNNYPALLTYDRYGQGGSARDPADDQRGGSHDIEEVVADLHALVREIWRTKITKAPSDEGQTPKLVFVANSIGCVVGRLYAQTYPGAAAALLLLDSNMANSDQVSLFPDPDAPDFDPCCLPPDSSASDLRRARAGYAAHFGPWAPNAEHLDRRTVASLLPLAEAPALRGEPWITVVGHDPEVFADEGLRGSLRVPRGLTDMFVNPVWARYNEGLARLTSRDRALGPVVAAGCGHFVQKDDPGLVAGLTDQLLRKIEAEGAA